MAIPIRDLINQDKLQKQKALTSTSQTCSSDTEPTAFAMSLAMRVFAEFGIIYGHLWKGLHTTDEMRNAAIKVWASKLIQLKPEEIRKGIDACDGKKFPPSLPEFLEMARGPLTPKERTHHDAYKPYNPRLFALPKPVDKEIAKQAMFEIRSRLGMRHNEK